MSRPILEGSVRPSLPLLNVLTPASTPATNTPSSFKFGIESSSFTPLSTIGLRCADCAMRFARKIDLQRHAAIHSGETKHECHSCQRKFSLLAQLDAHDPQLCHNSTQKFGVGVSRIVYGCEDCGKIFKHKWSLTRHSLIHTGDRPHSCTSCTRSFSLRWQLLRHRKQTHAPEVKVEPVAPKATSTGGEAQVAPTEAEDHSIPVSAAAAAAAESVAVESVAAESAVKHGSRSRSMPYRCDECGKFFVKKSSLESHVELHGDAPKKPEIDVQHKCDVCGAVYETKANLSRHARTHTIERAFSCTIEGCGRMFQRRYDLKRHDRVHRPSSLKRRRT